MCATKFRYYGNTLNNCTYSCTELWSYMGYMSKEYQSNKIFRKFYEPAVSMFFEFSKTTSKHSSWHNCENEHEPEDTILCQNKMHRMPPFRKDEEYYNKFIEVVTEIEKETRKEIRAHVKKMKTKDPTMPAFILKILWLTQHGQHQSIKCNILKRLVMMIMMVHNVT